MLILRDSLVFGGLLSALAFVYAIDRWKSLNDDVSVATTIEAIRAEAATNGAEPATVVTGSIRLADEDEDETVAELGRVEGIKVDGNRTGIIDSFEPYSARMIDTPPPPPPSLIESPPPSAPAIAIVEIDESPPSTDPEPPRVRFFETEVRAQSVGYVVDCSSSMEGEKFQAVRLRLAESIGNLSRNQRFFVIFFNDRFFPMTGSAAPQLVRADAAHKRDILRFLRSAQASGGTNPEPALQFMTRIGPDVVYLLTDGEFNPLSESTYQGFKDAGIVVHTLGFETSGRVAILDEIAQRTAGTYQPAARGPSSSGLLFASEQEIKRALSGTDLERRRAAVSAAILQVLPFENQLIDMLGDSDTELRATIRDALRESAGGSDFGPETPNDVDAAIRRWKLWRTLRNAGRTRLVAALEGSDPDALWVAAAIARATQLDAPDAFIAALRASPHHVIRELRAALVHCSGGEDFGPALDATGDEVGKAADLWQAWRDAALAREAIVNRERRVQRAAELLSLAKRLIGVNDAAVKKRYEELIADYGDTPAGEEARSLLEALLRQQ